MPRSATLNLPANFRRIRLELAREPGHPVGEAGIGYTMIAPLKDDGLLDIETARHFRDQCTVIRFGMAKTVSKAISVAVRAAGGRFTTTWETARRMMIRAFVSNATVSRPATMSLSWKTRARTPIASPRSSRFDMR